MVFVCDSGWPNAECRERRGERLPERQHLMPTWRLERSPSPDGFELARPALNPVQVRTGLLWIPVALRRNEKRRLSVFCR